MADEKHFENLRSIPQKVVNVVFCLLKTVFKILNELLLEH